MNREEALQFIKIHVKNENSIKHMLAVEAVMRALAKRFGEDENKWGIAGLVHDVDMEKVDYKENAQDHGKIGVEMLKAVGVQEDILEAVMAHNPETGKKRETKMEKAIFASDPLTGLIVAATLVTPEKKINKITTTSILKRFKERSFAKGAHRETIISCKDLGMDLSEFINLGLSAMQGIDFELGL